MDRDAVLIQQTLLGDQAAFVELVNRHYRSIYALALHLMRQREDAEEIAQDVFVKAHARLAALRDPDKFAAWLHQITRRQCQTAFRRRRPGGEPLPDDLPAATAAADEQLLRREMLDAVMRAADDLPDLDRELLAAHYLRGASYPALQARHGLSYQAIAMRLFKARRRIRAAVEHSQTQRPVATPAAPPHPVTPKERIMSRHTYPTGLFPAKQDGLWGYIDRSGTMVIQPEFDRALGFSEGRARVGAGAKHGFIDQQGEVAVPLQYDWAYSFREGMAAVKLGERYGYIDLAGHMAVPARFDEAEDFREGIAAVQIGGLWGYIDKAGAYIAQPSFDKAWGFSGGLGAVLAGERYGYIDASGDRVWWPEA